MEVQFCRHAPTIASQSAEGYLCADDLVCVFVAEYLHKYFLSVVKVASPYFVDEDFGFGHD